MGLAVLAVGLLMAGPIEARAEWQIKPFLGVALGGDTTFVDVVDTVGGLNVTLGASAVLLGEVLGVEADFGHGPGFFHRDGGRVQRSSVTTLSGGIVVALPRRLAQYGLRPYAVGGAGMMHVGISRQFGVLEVDTTLPAYYVGGGVTGFLSDRFGLSWDLRHIRSFGGSKARGVSIGPEELSFWRATMALAIRY